MHFRAGRGEACEPIIIQSTAARPTDRVPSPAGAVAARAAGNEPRAQLEPRHGGDHRAAAGAAPG